MLLNGFRSRQLHSLEEAQVCLQRKQSLAKYFDKVIYMIRKNLIPLTVVAFHTAMVVCLALYLTHNFDPADPYSNLVAWAWVIVFVLDLPFSSIVALIWNALLLLFPSIYSGDQTEFQVIWLNAICFAFIGGIEWFLIFKYGSYLIKRYKNRIPSIVVVFHTMLVACLALYLARSFDPTQPYDTEGVWLIFSFLDFPFSLIAALIMNTFDAVFPSLNSGVPTEFVAVWEPAIFFAIIGAIQWFLISKYVVYLVKTWWRWWNSRKYMTDASLKKLARRIKLRALYLADTSVTDMGLKELAGLTQLHVLDLANTKVTDLGLKELSRLTQLQSLDLSFTHITDAGLKELLGLTKLNSLDLRNTQVTNVGVAELQKMLPNLKIHFQY
jgi:Leucine rich repeat/Leucine Rich repeat